MIYSKKYTCALCPWFLVYSFQNLGISWEIAATGASFIIKFSLLLYAPKIASVPKRWNRCFINKKSAPFYHTLDLYQWGELWKAFLSKKADFQEIQPHDLSSETLCLALLTSEERRGAVIESIANGQWFNLIKYAYVMKPP